MIRLDSRPRRQPSLAAATDLVGYATYLDRVPESADRRKHSSDNRVELDRARFALDLAEAGGKVAVVFGRRSWNLRHGSALMEAVDRGPAHWRELDIAVAPGISAFRRVAARLGAAMGGDFA